jgi:uncharacterized protein
VVDIARAGGFVVLAGDLCAHGDRVEKSSGGLRLFTRVRTLQTKFILVGVTTCVSMLHATAISFASTPSVRKPLPSAEEIKKLPADGGPAFNRLVFEKSPYLLQHAANPVNWYPWGEDAFAAAREQGKPIFLSIGYSTCHWCHVMEHESFEDDEVAAVMNAYFIAIKVDREERPDIDNVYMKACRALGKRGGWPLTIMMTPDKVPFFAGTYFPKTGRFGREGMMELIPRMGEEWHNEREGLLTSGWKVIARIKPRAGNRSGNDLDETVLTKGFTHLSQSFDSTYGGFGRSPKFPTPHRLSFLLRYWRRSGDPVALDIVEKTLQSMRRGGIYDHIGHGFHRYSTDAKWLVPHFEKMLYDQAMLVIAYVEAYQATGKAEYAATAREVLDYVLRDMTDAKGGFYSAEDADSEGVEGKFNVWSADEITKVLGDEADLYIKAYNIRSGGNFSNPHTPPATNIPHLTQSWSVLATQLGLGEADLRQKLEASRAKLFAVRERRIHPYKDDKILTDWNGLMIAAFAKAARAIDAPEYAIAAQRAADFIWDYVRDARGRLLKRHRGGESALPAHAADYAFMIWGLLDLYEANFEVRNLTRAIELNDQLIEHFWDDAAGGLFFTADDSEALPVRSKEVYDGAIPSGNSVAMLNFLRIARLTADASLEEKAASIGRAFSAGILGGPSSYAQLLCALDFGVGPSYEVVIVGSQGSSGVDAMISALRKTFAPSKVVLFRPDSDSPEITKIATFTKNHKAMKGKATAYVCRNHRCKLPTTDPSVMVESLREQSATTKKIDKAAD